MGGSIQQYSARERLSGLRWQKTQGIPWCGAAEGIVGKQAGGQSSPNELTALPKGVHPMMDLATVTRQVTETRQADTDDIPMRDGEIARAILDYARLEE